jgi:ribosomal protein S18 acetylase RimI-like enzyme
LSNAEEEYPRCPDLGGGRRAHAGDAGAITHILATGFRDDPPLAWILSDPDDRERLSPAFFKPFVDMVLTDGHAYITADLSGAALWLDVDVDAAGETEDADAFRRLFVEGLGSEYSKRFFVLDELFTANHPGHESHAYLVFIGAEPHRQNQGVGTALLAAGLAAVDGTAKPAYVEASSQRNAALYARHRFESMGSPIALPDGPSVYPMWRPATIGSPVTAA